MNAGNEKELSKEDMYHYSNWLIRKFIKRDLKLEARTPKEIADYYLSLPQKEREDYV